MIKENQFNNRFENAQAIGFPNQNFYDIYIVDGSPIKNSDWCINLLQYSEKFYKLYQYTNDNFDKNNPYLRKVIASSVPLVKEISCPDGIEDCEVYHTEQLPLVSKDFVELYNPNINEVTIEYICNLGLHTPSGKYHEDEPVVMKRLLNKPDYYLKVSENNEIQIIFPALEDKKVFTINEAEALCREAFKLYKGDNTGYPGLIRSQKEAENDWIEKNIYGKI